MFIDESGVLTNMARRYGPSLRGRRAPAKVPFGNWKRLSVLGAISLNGMVAAMSVEAAPTALSLQPTLTRCCCRGCARTNPMRCW